MKYLTLLKLRDQTIEDKFLEALPQQSEEAKESARDLLERAVEAANADLPRQLVVLFGDEKAKRILEDMNREAV